MTDRNPNQCTALTLYIEGAQHKEAAEAFMIQYADGGLDQEFEARLNGQGFTVKEMDFDMDKGTMTLRLDK